ncbi:hypothetical protein [Undibacter mobilis]|uniref:Uncharacterized protein n=1 Tax=Undibacter mobilis TaxID=2292256 RepID=A0A371B9V6_9BRAD|nr:hypothetical protein [Undibacter mobilis]RDV04193.1 hypothetical protein DXH78_06110 [Undibacter mobilis]
MHLKFVAVSCAAAIGALALLSAPADAQTTQKRTYSNRNNTVVVTRGEDGKTRTRIIIEKRSYLDPGTEVLPGSRHDLDYAQNPNHRATGILDNTSAGTSQLPLPGPWDSGRNGPWLKF